MAVVKELDDIRMMDAGSNAELVVQRFYGPGIRDPTGHEELYGHLTLVTGMTGPPYISDGPLTYALLQLEQVKAQPSKGAADRWLLQWTHTQEDGSAVLELKSGR